MSGPGDSTRALPREGCIPPQPRREASAPLPKRIRPVRLRKQQVSSRRAPFSESVTRTQAQVALGPVYRQGGDRQMRWFHKERVEASLLYADMHARVRVHVPIGVVNTTPDYTFLAVP